MMSTSKLRIAIIGVGGIGSAFAFQLSSVGKHDVTVIARPESSRLQQLRRDGGIVKCSGERAQVHVLDELNTDVPYDLVLVTLLAHQVDTVIPALKRSATRWIQFMFNNFEPEGLPDAVGPDRCSFGMPFIQASLDADGKLHARIGGAGQKTKMDNKEVLALFNGAALPSSLEPNMLLWLRCHAPLGAAFESACVQGMQRGGGASWREARQIAAGLQESFRLIQQLGYRLYPSGKALLHAGPAWLSAGILWSLSRVRSFRELLATGANESRALVDAIAHSASRVKQPISVSTILAMKP